MIDYEITAGATSRRVGVWLADSASTTGTGLTGLVFNSAGLNCYYWRESDGNVAATAVTLATATLGTWTTGGFIVKDGTNMPGAYEFHIPDAAIATGAKWVRIMFKGATNLAPRVITIKLVLLDHDTALSSQTIGTATVTGTVNALAANVITAASINADAITAAKIADGAIDAATFAAGAINAAAIAADAITAAKVADGTIDAATFAAGAINAAAIAADAITDAKVAADVTIASVTGAVGSVTGAVGSVTGAVGSVAAGGIVAASIAAGAITSAKFAAGAIDAAAISTDAGNEIADAMLDRDMATGVDSGSAIVRTPRQALRVLRNKAAIAAGTLTVSKEDDVATSWTATVTTAAGNPLASVDPA